MDQRDTPPVDEDDPPTPAVEVNPENIDLGKKPPRDDAQQSHPAQSRRSRPVKRPES